MVKITQQQIDSLGLSQEVINELASANALARKSLRNKIIRRFKESLIEEARNIDDPNEREKFQNSIDGKDGLVSQAREVINERIKSDGQDAKATARSFANILKPVTSMNIYHDGQRVEDSYLFNVELDGKIEIRNPKIEILRDAKVIGQIRGVLSQESVAPEGFKKNVRKIITQLEKLASQTDKDYKPKTVKISDISMGEFLGAIDVSKAKNRVKVYSYWKDIAQKYSDFEEDLAAFFLAVREVDWEEGVQELFDKLYKKVAQENLEYIVSFDAVLKDFESAHHRFFNILIHRMSVDGMLGKKESPNYAGEDDNTAGDVNSELLGELLASLNENSGQEIGNDEMADPNELNESLEEPLRWEQDYEKIRGGADPLLIYEYNKGDKLLSINADMEAELLDLLTNMVEKIDEGKGISLETEKDIEEWLEEMADTKIINESGEFGSMALPISVMANTNFNEMYEQDKFDSIVEKTPIGLDNLDKIKDFFGDLYFLLSGEDFRAELEVRSSKGMRRGSVIDAREARGTEIGEIDRGAKVPVSLNQKGTLRGELSEFKSALQRMMDSAIEYYFDPLYSGMLPIEIPSFGSSIGSKVMQTLSLDLGFDSVMSASYDTLFEGSVEEVDVGDLQVIADFLDNIFMPEVLIDDEMIVEGEAAADALTDIFGRREENDNYCAALIHHFMLETGDTDEENEDFHGKTIAERADLFHEDFSQRKAFPIFALPHWLDMNQGILTKKSPQMKTQYNRLKDIFETQQADLPVLLHKLLKAHDAIRKELGKPIIIGHIPFNDYGINRVINKMQVKENIDLTYYEVEQIVKAIDSHENISREYGISSEQVYEIKASFR